MSDIFDLERAVLELNKQKDDLTSTKKRLELNLTGLKQRVSGKTLPQKEYDNICKEQNKINGLLLDLEMRIKIISSDITKKSILKDELKSELRLFSNDKIKTALIELRDHYMNFASDRTRISSMRAMASEISESIERIIKAI